MAAAKRYHLAPMTSNAYAQDPDRAEAATPAPQTRKTISSVRLLPAVVAVLGAMYLLQALSPLRLDNDSVVYLRMATSFVDGVALDPTGLPPGYPALIALLDTLGLGFPFVFVLANIASIALGLVSAQYLFDNPESGRRSWVVPLTMLAVSVIKYMPMPLPESLFFGISLSAVAVMTAATRRTGMGRARLLLLALVLTLVAVTVRLVGVALVPALLWACCNVDGRNVASRVGWTFREKRIGGVALLGFMLVLTVLLGDSLQKYSYEAQIKYAQLEVWRLGSLHFQNLLVAFGEIVLNLLGAKFLSYRVVFPLVGFATLLWILSAVRLKRPSTPAAVYLVSFLAILVLWPYTALRLWLPIIPLLIGFAEGATLRFTPGLKWMLFKRLYVAWFVVAGLAAIAYTTRITFSGNNFSKVYGKAGGMSSPNRMTGRIDTLHNQRARELHKRYANPF